MFYVNSQIKMRVNNIAPGHSYISEWVFIELKISFASKCLASWTKHTDQSSHTRAKRKEFAKRSQFRFAYVVKLPQPLVVKYDIGLPSSHFACEWAVEKTDLKWFRPVIINSTHMSGFICVYIRWTVDTMNIHLAGVLYTMACGWLNDLRGVI